MSDNEEPIKIILLGDSGVGKTNIILRYIKDEFNSNSLSTIGTTFVVKRVEKNGVTYNLNIWDTTGQEAYRSITKLFIQGAKMVIFVYSIDRKSSFESLDYWYKSTKELVGDDIIIAIVASKMDLMVEEEGKFEISDEEGKKYAEEKNVLFKSVSAKSDKKGIDNLFDTLLEEYLKKKSAGEINEQKSIRIDNVKNHKKTEKKKKCC